MLGVVDLGVFIAGTVAVVLLPGPNSLYVLTVATRSGVRRGYAGACGVFTGDAVLMLLTALGAASVLHSHPAVFHVIRWVGAAYLAWLGVKLLIAGIHKWRVTQALPTSDQPAPSLLATSAISEDSGAAVYRRALVISLLNPKAIFFFISFFVQFVDPQYPYPALSFALLGAIVQVASALYLSTLIVGGVRLAQLFARHQRLGALLNTAVGALFVAFGVRLAA
ncbi:leucine efflux protein LeuE [Burkholderiaceae bacterium]|jgi:leucine efflux protein|nr:leucine efflux protein LeuE [Burkholderiaceae bacterium]MDO7580423.1 leucine efflux protein LeuE [Burkholderiaceae bacterium]MDO7595980.1 leucine efflux protein LeuE [Burkholderiaceae bacterium]MDO7606329.1 leucine efflux protein LeuE [Burkholderiaceae bacterium]MDO7703882.1 leucine efflux protein LeuE [Burkholderiaceae bacterium]